MERPRPQLPDRDPEIYAALWDLAVEVHDQVGYAMGQQRHPLARWPHREGCNCSICELKGKFTRAAELYMEAFPGHPYPWDPPSEAATD